jgi:hypothetical protein
MTDTIKIPPLHGRKLMGFTIADDGTYVVTVLWRDEPEPEYCVARVDGLDDPVWRNGVYIVDDLDRAYRNMIDRAGVALLV